MEGNFLQLVTETANQLENEQQLPEKYKVEAFKLLLQHKLGLKPVTNNQGIPVSSTSIDEEITFSEFLNQIEEPKTNPHRFAAIAYYFESSNKGVSITQDEIMATMAEAGLVTPKNFSRDIRSATTSRQPLLMTAENKDGKPAWRLTRTGRSFIEQKIKNK